MARIYDHVTVTVAAGKTNTEDVFTSTTERPRKLLRVSTIEKTALNDLLVYDDVELIANAPCDLLPALDDKLEFNRVIKVGRVVRVGFHNGEGGGITAKYIMVESEIPDVT